MSDPGVGDAVSISAIVLAGGQGSRFGGPKLSALVDGVPLLHRAVLAVAVVAAEVVVVARPAGWPDLPAMLVPIRVVHDPEPDGGPLVALAAGLEVAAGASCLVVGGDMPRLHPAVLAAMVERVGAGRGSAIVLAPPAEAAPRQSLPLALETASALAAANDALKVGRRSLQALLDALEVVEIPSADWLRLDPAGGSLDDVDEPADLERLARGPIEPTSS